MKIGIYSRILSSALVLSLVFTQGVFPSLVIAQEATQPAELFSGIDGQEQQTQLTLEITPTPSITPTDTPTPTATTTPTTTPEPNPTPTPLNPQALWTNNNDSYTTEILKLGVTYKFPLNEKVSLTFTKLPTESGTVTVTEHDAPATINNPGSKDYEITSTMENGSFEFDLTLPTNDPNKNVLSSQDGQNYSPLNNEKITSLDAVTIKGINHLTHFLVGELNNSNDTKHPVINEFFSSGSNDWIELYNPRADPIDLSGWKLDDNGGTSAVYTFGSVTIPAGGFVLQGGTFGLNNDGDTVRLIDSSGNTRDAVPYGSEPNALLAAPSSSQSGRRIINSGTTWEISSNITQGFTNENSIIYVDDSYTEGSEFGTTTFPFNTIQEGVNAVISGGTVNVAAGTYTESVVVNKTLTLSGVGATTVISPTVDQDGIKVTANNVVIKDLKVVTSNSGVTPNIAVRIEGTSGVEISGNVIETTGNKAMGIWICGTTSGCSTTSNLTIKKNTITINDSATGIYAEEASPAHAGWTIGGTSTSNANTITANLGNPLELYDVSASEVSYNNLTTAATGGSNVIWSSQLSDISNLVFKNNTVVGSGGSQVAFLTDFLVLGDGLANTHVSIVTISENTFSSWGSRALRIGDGAGVNGTTVTGVTISSNTFNMTADPEVIGGTAGGSATGTGNTFNVSGTAKIQKAIDAARTNDIINVAVGTYTEDLTIASGKTNLELSGTGSPTIKGVSTVPVANYPQAVPNIEILASGVKLHGFTIEGPDYSASTYASGMIVGSSNVEIYSNAFRVPTYSNGNTAMSNAIQTWHKNNKPTVDISGLNIHDNTFAGLSSENAGYEGIYLNLDTGTSVATIQNNIFTGNIFRAITTERSKTTITGNTITNNLPASGGSYTGTGGWQGINIGGANDFGAVTDILVSANTITGSSEDRGFSYGVKLGFNSVNAFSGVSVTNNTIHRAGIAGVRVMHTANGILANTNDLSDNVLGAKNEDATNILNAINNWWGVASPSWASTVFGLVSYDPWWMDANKTLPSTFINTFNTIHDDLVDQDIENNIDTCGTHPNSCSGLYFKKVVNGISLGKLFFTNTLDLTSNETTTFLQNLGNKLEQGSGRIAFDARESSLFSATGATLEMYNLPVVTQSNLVVRNDTGTILDQTGLISNFSYSTGPNADGDTNIVSFNAAHFTQFDIDTTKPTTLDNVDGAWHNTTQTITLTCIDNLSGCDKTYYTTDGSIPTTSSSQGNSVVLATDGTYTIKYFSVDKAGNAEEVKTSANQIRIDKTNPDAPIVTSIATDNKINNAEKSAIVVTGTAEANSLVSVTLSDGANSVTNTQQLTNGAANFSVTLNGANALPAGLTDGTITPSVTAKDAANNVSNPATTPIAILDTASPLAPNITLLDPINNSNKTAVTITGTGEANAAINYTITDSTNTITGTSTVNNEGVINITGINVSTLIDGTLTASVTIIDTAGNISTTGADSAAKDAVIPSLSSVGLSSSNSNNAAAKVGDTATLTFVSSESIQAPTVTIAGHTVTATNTTGNTWTAIYTLTPTDTEGVVILTIGFVDIVGNAGNTVNATTNNSSVLFDKTAPSQIVANPIAGSYSSAQTISFTSSGSSVIMYSTTQTLSGCAFGNVYSSPITISSSTNLFTISCDDAGNSSKADFSYTIGNTNLQPPSENLGQVSTPATVMLNNNASLDVSGGRNIAVGGIIKVDGVDKSLSSFSSNDLSNKDLTVPQSVGGQLITINQAVKLESTSDISLANADLTNVNVSIPNNTTVLAPTGWDGRIQPPKAVGGSGSAPTGFSLGNTVIEVGSADTVLLFDKPVVVTLSGVTGDVGYKAAGSTTWHKIDTICNSYDSPTNVVFPGECRVSNGTDTRIYTYHFTTFGSLDVAPVVSGEGSVGGVSGLSASGAPVCVDTKPSSAPKLLSAQITGFNEVTLTWSPASDPVTYYLVAYGTKSGELVYGNPDVGGRGTTSFTVEGLSGGKTYYFKVRAGNGCMPGDYSNEVSVTPLGVLVEGPAQGFQEGVLGEQEVKGEIDGGVKATATDKPSLADTSKKPFSKPLALFVILVVVGGGYYLLRRRA
ncbi:MAG: lamin tail domain-containing protein [Candidatus Blackburnbacteria bacterium]|nr:lamin tail domain-containing protein [Candidatus Blackburnbacteria bacterium]